MDCSPPGSSVHEIFQARILEWGAISFSKNIKRLLLVKEDQCFPGGPGVKNSPAKSRGHVFDLVWKEPTCCEAAKPVLHGC